MTNLDRDNLKERIRGSLELSMDEIEMMGDIVISMFDLSYAMNQHAPEELKAIREKLSILKEDLWAEYKRRIDLLNAANQ